MDYYAEAVKEAVLGKKILIALEDADIEDSFDAFKAQFDELYDKDVVVVNKAKYIEDVSELFCDLECRSLDLRYFDASNIVKFDYMFWNFHTNEILFKNFDTSKAESMRGMFCDCTAKRLNLDFTDTSNVLNMSEMLSGVSLYDADISKLNTSKCETMAEMFYGVSAKDLDLSHFETSWVLTMSGMFAYSSIEKLDLSTFFTSQVMDFSSMFSCATIQYLDLRSFIFNCDCDCDYMLLSSSISKIVLSGVAIDESFLSYLQEMAPVKPNNLEGTELFFEVSDDVLCSYIKKCGYKAICKGKIKRYRVVGKINGDWCVIDNKDKVIEHYSEELLRSFIKSGYDICTSLSV